MTGTLLGKLRRRILGAARTRRADLRKRARALARAVPVPALPQIRAGVAAGGPLLDGLAWEWTQLPLTPSTWAAAVERGVDLVLLERSGAGVPGWDDASMRALVQWCQAHEVPVVAWVTSGDPAEPWINGVRQLALPPAAQPRLHNPLLGGPARLRPAAAAAPSGRHFAAEVPVDVWPPEETAALTGYRVVSADSAEAAIWAGAGHASVVAERHFAAEMPSELRGLVTEVSGDEELRAALTARIWQDELCDREGLQLARAVRAAHTYGHRVDAIAAAADVEVDRGDRTVSMVVPTNRAHQLDNVLANVARQQYGPVELVLVPHGLDLPEAEVKARAADAGIDHVTVVPAEASLALGACMNLGLDAAGGTYVAKIDDDNHYGPHYLTDLVAAFGYTDAGIVGKWAHYVWLQSTGAVVLRSPRSEHSYVRLVQGGSMVLTAAVARELRFTDDLPRGVDTDLLNRAQQAGIRTYAGDRFNYVSIRGADRTTHTWTISDAALLNRAGKLLFYGDPRPHVDV